MTITHDVDTVASSIHDMNTVCYPIVRVPVDSSTDRLDPVAAAEPKSVLKALALIVGAVIVLGLGAVAAAAYLVTPVPQYSTVVRPAAVSPHAKATVTVAPNFTGSPG